MGIHRVEQMRSHRMPAGEIIHACRLAAPRSMHYRTHRQDRAPSRWSARSRLSCDNGPGAAPSERGREPGGSRRGPHSERHLMRADRGGGADQVRERGDPYHGRGKADDRSGNRSGNRIERLSAGNSTNTAKYLLLNVILLPSPGFPWTRSGMCHFPKSRPDPPRLTLEEPV